MSMSQRIWSEKSSQLAQAGRPRIQRPERRGDAEWICRQEQFLVLQPLTMAELHLVRIWVQCRRAGGQPQLHVVFVVPRLRMHERRVTFVGSEQITLGQGWALVRALSFGRDDTTSPSIPRPEVSLRLWRRPSRRSRTPYQVTSPVGYISVNGCGPPPAQPRTSRLCQTCAEESVREATWSTITRNRPPSSRAIDPSARKEGSKLGALACSSATNSPASLAVFARAAPGPTPSSRRQPPDPSAPRPRAGSRANDEVGGKACQLTAAIGSVSRGLGVGGKRPISWLVMSFSAARVRRPPSNPPTQYGSARSPSSRVEHFLGRRVVVEISPRQLGDSPARRGRRQPHPDQAARPRLRPPRRARCRRHRRRVHHLRFQAPPLPRRSDAHPREHLGVVEIDPELGDAFCAKPRVLRRRVARRVRLSPAERPSGCTASPPAESAVVGSGHSFEAADVGCNLVQGGLAVGRTAGA